MCSSAAHAETSNTTSLLPQAHPRGLSGWGSRALTISTLILVAILCWGWAQISLFSAGRFCSSGPLRGVSPFKADTRSKAETKSASRLGSSIEAVPCTSTRC